MSGTLPLLLELRPSRRIAAALWCWHLGAVLCLLASALPWWARAGMAVAALAPLPRRLARHARLDCAEAVVGLGCDARGAWTVHTRARRGLEISVDPHTLATPGWSVLALRRDGTLRCVLVAPDSAPREQRRRLCAALRIAAGE